MVFHMLFRIYIQFAKESQFEYIITYKGLFYKTYYFVPAIFFIYLTNYNATNGFFIFSRTSSILSLGGKSYLISTIETSTKESLSISSSAMCLKFFNSSILIDFFTSNTAYSSVCYRLLFTHFIQILT